MVQRMNFTQIIIILSLSIALIGYIIYFLYKNKEKVKNIDLKKLIKEKKASLPKWLNKKNIFISLGTIATTVIIIWSYIG